MFASTDTNAPIIVEQIPLKVRRCFIKAMMLLTRYPQLGGKTGGTYNSPVVSSYKCDRIPDSWYKTDAVDRLCQLFELSNDYALEIENLLSQIDRQILRQQKIIQALINNYNGLSRQEDVTKLFQALFGIGIPKASINCLTTKMQIVFIIDYQQHRLREENLWHSLSPIEQQHITLFLNKISQFSFKQFANFPSFGYLEARTMNPQLYRQLVQITGYSEAEVWQAIASSVGIVSTSKAESFLLHDIWGHYWQTILTQFNKQYTHLSQCDLNLTINSTVNSPQESVSLSQLFKRQDKAINLDIPLAKSFFHSIAKRRIAALSTHLISEILADINEYKWLSQNRDRAELLPSSSNFKNCPTKLDLTIKDLDFIYLPILETLIKLRLSNLEAELIDHFQLIDNQIIDSLRKAILLLQHIFLVEYIDYYQPSIQANKQFSNLASDLSNLQQTLNNLYIKSPITSLPFKDLIILFVASNYADNGDIEELNSTVYNYFQPCWLSINTFT